MSTILLALLFAVSSLYLLATNYGTTILGLVKIYPFSLLFVTLFAVAMLLVNILSYAN